MDPSVSGPDAALLLERVMRLPSRTEAPLDWLGEALWLLLPPHAPDTLNCWAHAHLPTAPLRALAAFFRANGPHTPQQLIDALPVSWLGDPLPRPYAPLTALQAQVFLNVACETGSVQAELLLAVVAPRPPPPAPLPDALGRPPPSPRPLTSSDSENDGHCDELVSVADPGRPANAEQRAEGDAEPDTNPKAESGVEVKVKTLAKRRRKAAATSQTVDSAPIEGPTVPASEALAEHKAKAEPKPDASPGATEGPLVKKAKAEGQEEGAPAEEAKGAAQPSDEEARGEQGQSPEDESSDDAPLAKRARLPSEAARRAAGAAPALDSTSAEQAVGGAAAATPHGSEEEAVPAHQPQGRNADPKATGMGAAGESSEPVAAADSTVVPQRKCWKQYDTRQHFRLVCMSGVERFEVRVSLKDIDGDKALSKDAGERIALLVRKRFLETGEGKCSLVAYCHELVTAARAAERPVPRSAGSGAAGAREAPAKKSD